MEPLGNRVQQLGAPLSLAQNCYFKSLLTPAHSSNDPHSFLGDLSVTISRCIMLNKAIKRYLITANLLSFKV